MRLSQVGEFGLIERIRKATPRGRGVRLGIGDDAAWVECRKSTFLVTSDLLIQGVHFNLRWASFYTLGYKTLAVNLSDLAAMGGTPAYLLLSLGIPADFRAEYIEEFYRGLRTLASRSGVSLIGGDTSVSKRFFISAFLVGYAPYGAITRRGAKVGDDIYTTGTLGDSALGLELLRHKKSTANRKITAYLLKRHRLPTARLKAGAVLARERLAKAMIDVSDGLIQDLGHICRASKVGAVIWQETLPISRAYRLCAGNKGALRALTGGEDYELLFCLRRRDRSRLDRVKNKLDVPLRRIGKCVSYREGIKVIDGKGKSLPIPMKGHDHFKNNV